MADGSTWDPMPLSEAVELFRAAPFRWWISGGHALDLHLGESWRAHADTDVGLCRDDLDDVRALLSGWDLWFATDGRLVRWDASVGTVTGAANNLWCRPAGSAAWTLDVTIGTGDAHRWRYRRDPSIARPWAEAVLTTEVGVPHLAPELQLLFKSTTIRDKDQLDAEHVIPRLDRRRLHALADLLPAGHRWQPLIAGALLDQG